MYRLGSWCLKCWNILILDVFWKWPFRCSYCVGESGSLSVNPFESHLCFSLTHLWPFSSSPVPNSLPVRSGRGKGEAGGGERGNIFLWMFPVVLSVHKRFQASRSHRAFLANTGGQAHYLLLTDHSKRRQSLTKLIATRGLVKYCEKHGVKSTTITLTYPEAGAFLNRTHNTSLATFFFFFKSTSYVIRLWYVKIWSWQTRALETKVVVNPLQSSLHCFQKWLSQQWKGTGR